ncbi:hypothetical protein ABLG96_01205 [Nakamurella sp. A5-74]|uniref:Uncharacterized protein n=1 Tax=Nakamurella sp. A5-74 TaxID=3158264 RepID=A0AAU8DNY1_9ACTN
MARDVVVGGFEVGGSVDCEVEDGGRVVEGVVLGAVDDGFDVGVLGTEAVGEPLEETEPELRDGVPCVVDPDPDVVTTEGLTVNGTSPLLVGSATGSDEQPDKTSTAATRAHSACLLNCVMNLPDPPAERPSGLLLPDVGDYPQSSDSARVVHTMHPIHRLRRAKSTDRVTG